MVIFKKDHLSDLDRIRSHHCRLILVNSLHPSFFLFLLRGWDREFVCLVARISGRGYNTPKNDYIRTIRGRVYLVSSSSHSCFFPQLRRIRSRIYTCICTCTLAINLLHFYISRSPSNNDCLCRTQHDSPGFVCLQHGTRCLRYYRCQEAWRSSTTTQINPTRPIWGSVYFSAGFGIIIFFVALL